MYSWYWLVGWGQSNQRDSNLSRLVELGACNWGVTAHFLNDECPQYMALFNINNSGPGRTRWLV